MFVNLKIICLAAVSGVVALAGCGSVGHSAVAKHAAVTRTVTVKPSKARSSPSPRPTATKTAVPAPAPSATSPAGVQAVTPWAVVSEYYGDIESGDYAGAYALLSSGSVTGQTFQQFEDGFACTSYENLRDLGTTGNTVSISLDATECDGTVNHYQGTYTIQNGLITAADITQTR
jgi:hypothetical protein